MEKDFYVKVEGHNNLVRDTRSNAIINTDKRGYQTYKTLKKTKSSDKIRIDQIESDLSSLKNDIGEIKTLLQNLLKNNSF
jgi:triacylglycerol esterase/lipase EstA (alpha/beta hydrolase family)